MHVIHAVGIFDFSILLFQSVLLIRFSIKITQYYDWKHSWYLPRSPKHLRVLELFFMHYFPNCFFNLQCTAMHPSTITLGIFQLQIFAPIIYGYTVFSLKSLLSLGSESIWFTVENIKWLWTTLYIYAHFVIYVYHIYLWVNARSIHHV